MLHTHKKGKQKRIMGWYKGDSNLSPRETEHCYAFPHFCLRWPPASWPCHVASMSNIPMDAGSIHSRVPCPQWHPQDSPGHRSPAAPWHRQRGHPGRPRGEQTHGLWSPGSRWNPARQGQGGEGKVLPEPQLLRGWWESCLWCVSRERAQLGVMLCSDPILVPTNHSWWWG